MSQAADEEKGEGKNAIPEHKDKGALKPIAETTKGERIAGIVAGTAVGTSAVAMAFSQGAMVMTAGVLACFCGPVVYFQQTKLTDIAAMKETGEAVSREIDRLKASNDRLAKSTDELREEVNKLEACEDALNELTQTQGQSVEAYEQQVMDMREILAQMQRDLRANIMQNLLAVVIRSDGDGSMSIEEDEVDDLIYRIKSINGVIIDREVLLKPIRTDNGNLQAVIEALKNHLSYGGDDDVSVEEEE